MPTTKLREFLDSHGVKYVTIRHSTAYTAQEVAASAHIRGKEMAKTVIIRVDGNLAMAVVPAAQRVEPDRLKSAIAAKTVEVATEQDFRASFPECELGAMPPFGNLYGMDVYVEERLSKDEEIAFNACSHNEVIRLSFGDFGRLVQPKVLSFARAN